MSDIDQLRQSIEATKGQLKAAQRVIRTSLQFVNDLERQLDELELPAEPQEAERSYECNGYPSRPGKVRLTVEA